MDNTLPVFYASIRYLALYFCMFLGKDIKIKDYDYPINKKIMKLLTFCKYAY